MTLPVKPGSEFDGQLVTLRSDNPGTRLVAKTAAGSLLNHRLHDRSGCFDKMDPHLLEQVSSLLGGTRIEDEIVAFDTLLLKPLSAVESTHAPFAAR
jgi:hypothetical protein